MNQTIQYRTAEQVSSDNIGMFFCTFSSKKNILVSRENSGLKAVWSNSAQCSSTGKEKDSETGYYYFGARYYNSDLSIWLSVDPMADKYPSLSPYNYCAWNPMKLVDPNGMELDDYFSKSGKYLGSDDAKTDNVRIIDEDKWNSISKDGKVDHSLGYNNSQSFSAGHGEMSKKAQLDVYNHYNPTKCELVDMMPKDKGNGAGMRTQTVSGKTVIGIFLKNNFSGMNVSDHAWEIESLFVHEAKHVSDHQKKAFIADFLYEESALIEQFTHDSFAKCRPEFRHTMTEYAKQASLLPSLVIELWDPYAKKH